MISEFDYDEHKKNFINYLEVIIKKDGTVLYAIPSHQRKLVSLYCSENNITEDELYELIPLTDSPVHWMCYYGKYVSVWYGGIICPIDISDEQVKALSKMIDKGILSRKLSVSSVFYDDKYKVLRSLEEVIEL